MATEVKPETKAEEQGRALAPRKIELPPELQAKVQERQIQSRMVAEIKGATWSKEVDASAIRAIASWARENDVEPVTEINVLGGNIYINARHYERKLGELVALGLVTSFRKDWIQIDERVDKLAALGDEDAKAESGRRTWERIKHGIDDKADFACVYYVQYRGQTEAAVGAKQHIPGKKRKIKGRDGRPDFEVDADPVGDQFGMETIETRALRRAMLKLKFGFPVGFRMATRDEDTIELAEIVQAGHEHAKAERAIDQAIGTKPLAVLNAGNPADPYAVAEKPAPVPAEIITPPAADPWDGDTDEELRRQDAELKAREEQGGFPLGDTRASRSAQSQGH